MSETLCVAVAAVTDVGRRSNNEDTFVHDAAAGLFVVCDGMGGEEAGEVASQLAVEVILSYIRAAEPPALDAESQDAPLSERGRVLLAAIRAANREIYNAAQTTSRRTMGSTVVALLITGGLATIAHVGDSRAYLVRGGAIQLLTEDHSLIAEQVRAGVMTEEVSRQSHLRNYITKALGPADDVVPDVDEIPVAADDLFLLATDGLTGVVTDEQILEIIGSTRNLNRACAELIARAKQQDSRDNITCLLAKVQKAGWFRKMAGVWR